MMELTVLRTMVVVVVVVVLVCGVESSTPPQVVVSGGPIVGGVYRSAGGRHYYAYRAVPYAAAPVGDLKFQNPVPPEPWTTPRMADAPGPFCVGGGRGYMTGEEDCLTVSVYTPVCIILSHQKPGDDTQSLPVLVWLPGGAFVVSGAAAYDPTILMDIDVVLVIPQYRLGIYGFLYMAEGAPGNYGLLDQVAALQWVQQNIGQFGGDPLRVTLAGDCAGGASALYHMISPLSEGLFQGVISLSGTPLNSWARHLIARQTNFLYSIFTGCPRYSPSVLKGCFADTNIDRMKLSLMTMSKSKTAGPDLLYIGNNNQAPVVQYQHGDPQNRFLDEEPVIKFGQGNFAKLLSDALYYSGYIALARYLNDHVPTYLLSEIQVASTIPPGAGNLDPLHYFLPEEYQPFATEDQKKISSNLLYIIKNFIADKVAIDNRRWPREPHNHQGSWSRARRVHFEGTGRCI
ncbi:hypothetical protein HAZT_HAZT003528 [Hyalella azteca]|uniref:Carboxylesterase type B domain-containing protein n=1 Tax=Hyalella azteca TaxID=294128 RepID=A0A6A0H1V4_HYAAZ|nr:hypothetical protein HAZT_HAZT003528 [Hyalella azteca]